MSSSSEVSSRGSFVQPQINQGNTPLNANISLIAKHVFGIFIALFIFQFRHAYWLMRNFSEYSGETAFGFSSSKPNKVYFDDPSLMEKVALLQILECTTANNTIERIRNSQERGCCYGESLSLVKLIREYPNYKMHELIPSLKEHKQTIAYYQTVERLRYRFLVALTRLDAADPLFETLQKYLNEEDTISHEEQVALLGAIVAGEPGADDSPAVATKFAYQIFSTLFLTNDLDRHVRESYLEIERDLYRSLRIQERNNGEPVLNAINELSSNEDSLLILRNGINRAHTVLIRICEEREEFVLYDIKGGGVFNYASKEELLNETLKAFDCITSGLSEGSLWEIESH